MSRDGKTPGDGKTAPFGDGQGKSAMAAAKPRDLTSHIPFAQPKTTGDPIDPQTVPAGGEDLLKVPMVTPRADGTGNPMDPLGGGQKPYKLTGG